jgi:hypothetical protein
MSVASIIRQLCEPCRPTVHQARATAVEAVAEAIAQGGRLSPSHVGRVLRGEALPKHSIKRVDRLLSNAHLHGEWQAYYSAIAARVLVGTRRPVVVIDWSGTVKGLHTLAAAVPVGGRAATIYAEVHPEAKYSNREVQIRFLRTLRSIIGPDCQPIIVADAGFRAPFMKAVRALGWDFVTRVRGRICVRESSLHPWVKCTDLYDHASRKVRDLGRYRFTQDQDRRRLNADPVEVRLVVTAKPKRKAPKRPTRPPVSGLKNGHGVVQAAREPWLLATSLELSPKRIVQLYSTRMQIEEMFRDCKSHRFGWSLRHVTSRNHLRMTTLLMLAAIAMTAVLMLGIAAEASNIHRRYQANTLTRRVLSFFCLGRLLIARAETLLTADRIIEIAHDHFQCTALTRH